MITPNDVKLQLMATLPQYTDEFSDTVEGSASVDTGVVLMTSVAHGLTTGDVITVSEVKAVVPVSSISFDSILSKATITTSFEHDRTSGTGDKGGGNIATLSGFADSNYNGDFAILSATRTTFTISADADVVGELGNLIEPRTLNLGFQTVTVLTVDTFTTPLDDTQIPNGTVFDTYNYVSEQRILIAADPTRATTMFGQRRGTKPTLFILTGSENASKDRNIVNDSITTANAQNPLNLVYIPTFTLMEIACTKTQQSAADKQQQVKAVVVPAIRKAMYGFVFGSDNTAITFAGVESGNTPQFWNQDHYVHLFDYEIPYRITIEQGFNNKNHVSFRDIAVNSKMFNNEGALLEMSAELEI